MSVLTFHLLRKKIKLVRENRVSDLRNFASLPDQPNDFNKILLTSIFGPVTRSKSRRNNKKDDHCNKSGYILI